MTDENARNAARAAVEAAGWRMEGDLIAEKQFDSAVGPKKALIWIGRGADQVGNFSVTGEFWSEGRNILEPRGLILNVDTPAEKVAGLVERFTQDLEAKIQDSYAVRLLET